MFILFCYHNYDDDYTDHNNNHNQYKWNKSILLQVKKKGIICAINCSETRIPAIAGLQVLMQGCCLVF